MTRSPYQDTYTDDMLIIGDGVCVGVYLGTLQWLHDDVGGYVNQSTLHYIMNHSPLLYEQSCNNKQLH